MIITMIIFNHDFELEFLYRFCRMHLSLSHASYYVKLWLFELRFHRPPHSSPDITIQHDGWRE